MEPEPARKWLAKLEKLGGAATEPGSE
jgi:hypothetical protein